MRLAFGKGGRGTGRLAGLVDVFGRAQLKGAHVVVGDDLVGLFWAKLAHDPFADCAPEVGGGHGIPLPKLHALAEAHAAVISLGKLGIVQALHAGWVGAQKANVAQIPDAWHRVVGVGGAVELGRNGAVAASADSLCKLGVDLVGGCKQAALGGREGYGPALGGLINLGVPNDQGRLGLLGVVGLGRGLDVSLAELDNFASCGRPATGLEDVKGLWGDCGLWHGPHCRAAVASCLNQALERF